MASPAPPQGLNEVDYEAIEAAVTETVRGRWFLNEFARRNRTMEMKQLLEAMARLETTVSSREPAIASADPSVRLLIQRIKEIAGQLEGLAQDMRQTGVDARFVDAAHLQARAVAGMMRNSSPVARGTAPPMLAASKPESPAPQPPALVAATTRPDPEPDPRSKPELVVPIESAGQPAASAHAGGDDPRLHALSAFDGLPLAKKLALFS